MKRTDGALFGITALAVVLVVYALTADPTGALSALVMAMPFAAWYVFRARFNAAYLSPTLIVAGFFAAIGAFGYMLRRYLSTLNGRGTSLSITLSDAQSFQTLILIVSAATILITASGLILTAVPTTIASARLNEWEAASPKGILIFLSAIPLVGIVASAGIDQLVSRPSYMFIGPGSFVGAIGGSVGTAMVVVVGYLFGASRGAKRSATVYLAIGYTVLLFAMGSRRFALVPILFGIGMFLAKNSRRARLTVIACAALSVALLPLPLMFRGSLLHGIAPYFQIFTQMSPADADWAAAMNNVLVSFPIIGATAFGGQRVHASDLLVSLNPFPGDSAGWYAIAPNLRLNAATPTAGLGELANVGWVPFALFFIAAGLILAWADRRVRRHLADGSHIFAAILLGLTAFFAFQMVQYNLRSAARMLVYMVAAEAAVYLLRIFFAPKRSEVEFAAKEGVLAK